MASTQTEHHIIVRKDWRTSSDILSTPKNSRPALYSVKDHRIVVDRLREKEKQTGRVLELDDWDDNDALEQGTGLRTSAW
jgi:hypothetical protein